MTPTVVFDVRASSGIPLFVVLVLVGIIAVGIAIRTGRMPLNGATRRKQPAWVGTVAVIWGATLGAIFVVGSTVAHAHYCRILDEARATIVEGVVAHSVVQGNKRPASFDVAGVRFRFSSYEYTGGFDDGSSTVIRDGTRVRIAYAAEPTRNVILRIETLP